MTHRDEQLAKDARIEAQSRELDDLRAELELLRSAHAHKVREVEQLKREASNAPLFAPADSPEAMRRAFGMTGCIVASSALMLGLAALVHHVPSAVWSARLTAASATQTYSGQVRSSNDAHLASGERCTIHRAHLGGHECRFDIRCGDQTVYGGRMNSGIVSCDSDRSIDGHFSEQDGDPAMLFDGRERRVVVQDRAGLFVQRLEIELDEPRR